MNIGIIGGGQLGLMMAEAAKLLNHKIISLDPNPNCPLARISDKHIAADYNDKDAMEQLNDLSDVLTYEFENVDLDLISKYEDKILQGTKALEISRNRLNEKNMAKRLGIETARFHKLIGEEIKFFPCIVKTTTGGYDGKGQYLINDKNTIENFNIDYKKEHIVEEFINFDYEISMILCRDIFDNIEYFPIPVNVHKNNILFTSTVSNTIPSEIQKKVEDYSSRIIEELDYVGTMAIEYFIKGDQVIFNELAPRPHNSGHYTIEACNVSQFYNHILAITHNTILKPVLLKSAIMLNILGQNTEYFLNTANNMDINIHLYGKDEYKENRKIGHITITKNNLEDANVILKELTKE